MKKEKTVGKADGLFCGVPRTSGRAGCSYGKSAGATASATIAGRAVIVNEQKHNDNEQNPSAIIATEDVSQTHIVTPLTVPVYAHKREA